MLTFGSLFAGIRGFDLALARAGCRGVFAAEMDKQANSVGRRHFRDERTINDVRDVRGAGFSCDILCAGWPCQGNSVAGRRAGLADDRSGLWWEVVRILSEQRPRWFLGENVPGILSVNGGQDWSTVLGSLGELGYGFAWRVLDAQYFGVPQRRRRVFLVGCLGDWRSAAEVLFERDCLPWDSPPRRSQGEVVTGTISARTEGGGGLGTDFECDGGLIAKCLNAKGGCGRIDGESETFVAQTLTANGDNHTGYRNERGLAWMVSCNCGHTFTGLLGEPCPACGEIRDGYTHGDPIPIQYGGSQGGKSQNGLGVGECGSPSYTLDSQGPTHAVAFRSGVRRLTPLECERLQGFPSVLEWSMNDMTRDEFAAALLASGAVVVDTMTGTVARTRGGGGRKLAKAEPVEGCNVNGYLAASFRLAGVRMQIRLHRLVWIAANGVPPLGMAVCHRNNKKTDNRTENLYLATPQQNSRDAHADGLYLTGENNPSAKISDADRRQIMDDYAHGDTTIYKLAAKYGISKSRVAQIVKATGWTAFGENGERIADGPRYRMLGNAIAVPCGEFLARRIVESEVTA